MSLCADTEQKGHFGADSNSPAPCGSQSSSPAAAQGQRRVTECCGCSQGCTQGVPQLQEFVLQALSSQLDLQNSMRHRGLDAWIHCALPALPISHALMRSLNTYTLTSIAHMAARLYQPPLCSLQFLDNMWPCTVELEFVLETSSDMPETCLCITRTGDTPESS